MRSLQLLTCAFSLLALRGAHSYQEELRGHQIWEVFGSHEDLIELMKMGLVDILGHSQDTKKVHVPAHTLEETVRHFKEKGIEHNVLIDDVASHLQEDRRKRSTGTKASESCTQSSCPQPLSESYMTFQQMEYYLKELNTTYASRLTVTSIGKSIEGRDIYMVHIKSGGCSEGESPPQVHLRHPRIAWWAMRKRAVWIEGEGVFRGLANSSCLQWIEVVGIYRMEEGHFLSKLNTMDAEIAGIHPREWISSMVVFHIIAKLAADSAYTRTFDVYAVPMANPDGYVYTWEGNRLWRKNRRVNNGSSCMGVDLNRNWGFGFGVGASNNPCSEVYKGSGPFSEPETKALSDAMLAVDGKGDVELVIAMHSFGQLFLYPWGYTVSEEAPDTKAMNDIGKLFAATAKRVYGTVYKVENAAAGLYFASGSTDDWAKSALKSKLVYTLELRDTGEQGFQLDASQIAPTVEEIWAGFKMVLLAITPHKYTFF